MTRSLSAAVFGFLVVTLGPAAGAMAEDRSKVPMYKRLLQGEDAKKAEELEDKIGEAVSNDDYATAIKVGNELLTLRVRVQGADHWESVDQQALQIRFQRIANLADEKRQSWRVVFKGVITARNLQSMGRYSQALPLTKAFQEWCEEVLGENYSDTAISYHLMASNLTAQGKYSAAKPLNWKALAVFRKVLGEDHPRTAIAYTSVAVNLQGLGKQAEAEPLMRMSLAISLKVLGENHPPDGDELQ